MLTVGKDSADVERRLREGRLAGWGQARSRVIRGEGGIGWQLRPRRAQCAGCGLLTQSVTRLFRDAAGPGVGCLVDLLTHLDGLLVDRVTSAGAGG